MGTSPMFNIGSMKQDSPYTPPLQRVVQGVGQAVF